MSLRLSAAVGAGCQRRISSRRGVTRRERRGSAVVEFAFVAPLIFLFFFVAFEFSRVLMVQHGLQEASRAACRQAVAWDATQTNVEAAAATRLGAFGITNYTITISPTPFTSACQWEPVSVNVSVAYADVSWLPSSRFMSNVTLSGTSILPQEADRCN